MPTSATSPLCAADLNADDLTTVTGIIHKFHEQADELEADGFASLLAAHAILL